MRTSIIAVGTAFLTATLWTGSDARAQQTIMCAQNKSTACLNVIGTGTDAYAVVSNASSATAFYGTSAAAAPTAAVFGYNSGSGYGVQGTSESGYGVHGWSDTLYGVVGESNTSVGVEGVSASAVGVNGVSGSSQGVLGSSTSGVGVYGQSETNVAVYGISSTANGVVGINSRTDWNAAAISALPGNTNGLAIYAGGGAQKPGGGSWSGLSDGRVKKDVKDFRAGLAELEKLRPVTYRYNGLGGTQDDGHKFVGIIAQELEKVMPDMVQSSRVKLRPDDKEETDLERVDPSAFTYVLINAVREQQRIIEKQDARIARLEAGRPALLSSLAPGNLGLAAIGLVPLGLVVVRRKRKNGDIGE